MPVMRQLKWALQRDRLAKVFKISGIPLGVGRWLDEEDVKADAGARRRVLGEGDKVRLAVCPGVRQRVGFFERLGAM